MRNAMNRTTFVGLLLLSIGSSCVQASPVSTDEGGTVVIVFKDGHRQSIPASSVTSMEFKSAAGNTIPIALPSTMMPSRRHFLGKWSVGEGNGNTFKITLEENGDASKSLGAAHGTWTYVDGEARVTWDDGWHDAIRKSGSKYEKFAYGPGKSFSDSPDNVTEAQNTSPRPI
jgi:hypothetical protein